jgi:hypothetical protein
LKRVKTIEKILKAMNIPKIDENARQKERFENIRQVLMIMESYKEPITEKEFYIDIINLRYYIEARYTNNHRCRRIYYSTQISEENIEWPEKIRA